MSHADDDELHEVESDPKFDFADEYAVTGWFKWNSDKEVNWHTAFRMTINDKDSNTNTKKMGDVELGLWVTSKHDGVYSFGTYSYKNL